MKMKINMKIKMINFQYKNNLIIKYQNSLNKNKSLKENNSYNHISKLYKKNHNKLN